MRSHPLCALCVSPQKSNAQLSLCQDKAFPRKNHINFALGNEIQSIAASPGVRTDFPRDGQRQTNIHRPTPRRIRRKTYSLYALPPRDPEREQPHAATTPPVRSPSDRRTATSAPVWNGGFQPPPHSSKQTNGQSIHSKDCPTAAASRYS